MSSTTPGFGLNFHTDDLSAATVKVLRIGLWASAVLSIVFGIVILVWPQATLGAIAFLFGLYFFIVGLVRVVTGIIDRGSSTGARVLNVVLGVLLIIAGIFALRNPFDTVIALTILIGIAWIVEGILSLTLTTGDSSKWSGIVLGVISIVAGAIVVFVPEWSLSVLVLFGGVSLVVLGVMQAVTALMLNRTLKGVR